MPEEQARLNPQITDVEIGIRNLRKITIYPLSMADQLTLTEMVTKSAQAQIEAGGGDVAVVSFIVKMLQENLSKILTMVTEEDESVLNDLSNTQAVEIADVIFDVNYGSVAKNFKSLSEKVKELFQSERPSQPSANDTPTALTTSTESPTETAA